MGCQEVEDVVVVRLWIDEAMSTAGNSRPGGGGNGEALVGVIGSVNMLEKRGGRLASLGF